MYIIHRDIQSLIEKGLPDASVSVSGDGYHYEALVISSEFSGLLTIKRHRLVYDTLGALVGNEIHALSLKTYTPEEATTRGETSL